MNKKIEYELPLQNKKFRWYIIKNTKPTIISWKAIGSRDRSKKPYFGEIEHVQDWGLVVRSQPAHFPQEDFVILAQMDFLRSPTRRDLPKWIVPPCDACFWGRYFLFLGN